MPSLLTALLATLVPLGVVARTDLSGCTSFDLTINPRTAEAYASVLWYVPGTGEVCEFLDCGGGRAPPITTVPGCGGYHGTATYSPSYIDVQSLTASGEIVPLSTSKAGATVTGGGALNTAASTSAQGGKTVPGQPEGVTILTGTLYAQTTGISRTSTASDVKTTGASTTGGDSPTGTGNSQPAATTSSSAMSSGDMQLGYIVAIGALAVAIGIW